MNSTKPRHILFVDDELRILDSIRRSLRGQSQLWSLSFAGSVVDAVSLLNQHPVDVIITDLTMPDRDGFDLMATVANSPTLNHIPVLVLTGLADENLKRRALDAGAFDLIGKPVCREDLIARIRSVLRTKDYQDSLANLNATLGRQVQERTRELSASRTEILVCLAMAGECRDTDTGRHLLRVAHYARRLAQALGVTGDALETIFKATPLHDIGKLGVPDGILLKPGPLTPDERAIMQRHSELGHRILTTPAALAACFDDAPANRPINPLLLAAAEIALNHHERWDGAGYPNHIRGEAIPFNARIVAVADVYDALTTHRPYKQKMSHADAINVLLDNAGTQFDPRIIAAMKQISGDFDAIRQSWSDSSDHQDDPIASIGMLLGDLKHCA